LDRPRAAASVTMKCARRCALVVALAATAVGAGVTPLGKVTQLLEEMKAKGIAAKKEEATKFAAFKQWCGDQDSAKAAEIEAASEKIEMHDAEIQKAEAEVRSLSGRLSELSEDIGRWKRDKTSASDVRGKEAADFRSTAQDFSESLDALDNAIRVLKKQAFDRAQAEMLQVHKSLIQVTKSPLLPIASKKALSAFLQQAQPAVEELPSDGLSVQNPEAHGYEFQSGGVVDMLERLKDQFGAKKYELEREEMNSKHAFQQMFQQLEDNIENAEHEISKKEEKLGETKQYKAEHEGDRATTVADKAEDEKYLSEMRAMCKVKGSDFESRQKLRGEELEAIQQAIDILSSEKVSGAAKKHLPSMLQKRGTRSLSQLRASQASPLQQRISTFLSVRAKAIDSRLLSMVSQRVAEDPFVKVKKMIKDLIVRLMEEATHETEHKGWCDAELATNKLTREAKTEDVEKLSAQVEDLTTQIAELSQDISELSAAVQELDAAMAEAASERAASREKNEKTIEDAKVAQEAVTQATAVLKDFYAKSAQATALTQQTPMEDAPETFNSPYTGMMPEGGNILSFLEVILSDFARLEADTATAEAMEVDEHKKFVFESKKDKALKQTEIEHKTGSKTDKEGQLQSRKEELKVTQEALDKAVAYYEKLKPTCVDSGVTYEERVRRREEEIQSLQEALQILAGTDVDMS